MEWLLPCWRNGSSKLNVWPGVRYKETSGGLTHNIIGSHILNRRRYVETRSKRHVRLKLPSGFLTKDYLRILKKRCEKGTVVKRFEEHSAAGRWPSPRRHWFRKAPFAYIVRHWWKKNSTLSKSGLDMLRQLMCLESEVASFDNWNIKQGNPYLQEVKDTTHPMHFFILYDCAKIWESTIWYMELRENIEWCLYGSSFVFHRSFTSNYFQNWHNFEE